MRLRICLPKLGDLPPTAAGSDALLVQTTPLVRAPFFQGIGFSLRVKGFGVRV